MLLSAQCRAVGNVWILKQIQGFVYKIIDEHEYVTPELITLFIVMSILSIRILQPPDTPKGFGFPILSTLLTSRHWKKSGIILSISLQLQKLLTRLSINPSQWSRVAETDPSLVAPGVDTV